jgi:hypothetical protein
MNTNSTFWIGHDHTVCQDYALSGVKPQFDLSYAIVCDGCSASPDVDIGARFLALAARECIITDFHTKDCIEFGKEAIRKSTQMFLSFPTIHAQSLDATLLAAWVKNKQLTAFLFGDGVLIHKTKDKVNTVHINLTSGAPDYLSYQLDTLRTAAYHGMKDNQKIVEFDNNVACYSPFYPVVITKPVEEGDVISVISDGINSFRKSDYTPIPWKELIDEFTGYKNFEGEFVLRRVSAFKRKCLKEGITHSDDISVASIIV